MQILVYVGGVLILITFAVMLVRRGGVEADAPTDSQTDVDTEVDA
jgi:NADH-quinone oxidoreductase subunit J